MWDKQCTYGEAIWPIDTAPVAGWARLAGPSESLWVISKAVFSYYSLFCFLLGQPCRISRVQITSTCETSVHPWFIRGLRSKCRSTSVHIRFCNLISQENFCFFSKKTPKNDRIWVYIIVKVSPLRNMQRKKRSSERFISCNRDDECFADFTGILTLREESRPIIPLAESSL